MLTMKAIMTYQEAYFLSGDEKKNKTNDFKEYCRQD